MKPPFSPGQTVQILASGYFVRVMACWQDLMGRWQIKGYDGFKYHAEDVVLFRPHERDLRHMMDVYSNLSVSERPTFRLRR